MKLDHRLIRPQFLRQCGCLVTFAGMQPTTHPARRTLSHCLRSSNTQSYCENNAYTGVLPSTLPHLEAANIASATQQQHVCSVSQYLQQHGILKINLGFSDPRSQYLEQLVLYLHEYHGHQLPISHSASRGWFWDVRPSNNTSYQTPQHQARSETMEEFPWHTDCSYEDLPPRFFALHVLQHDRFGGGTLSVMNVQRLSELLSPDTQRSLMQQEYGIKIPLEFVKDPEKREIIGSVLTAHQDSQYYMMRFRRDLITPLTQKASRALKELDLSLRDVDAQSHSTIHLTAKDLSAGSIILVDNRRWLHARNNILDPERHLRRVRWDAIPFCDTHLGEVVLQ